MRLIHCPALLTGLLLAGIATAQVGNTALLNPNTAEAADLAKLPHLNAATAGALLKDKPYLTTAAFDAALAKTLSPAQRTELYGRLFLQINLNTATGAEILLIPGMNARMAHEFEEYRPYTSLTQFRREMGKYVDAKEVARLEQYVFVPLNLNTASEADILTIPGMTKRMAHEFEEYRPYTSIEQFRREIGKYVDAKEVARLESYVTLK